MLTFNMICSHHVLAVLHRIFYSHPLADHVPPLIEFLCMDDHTNLRYAGIANSAREEESRIGIPAFQSVGRTTKDGALGTAGAPIHMVASETGQFKEQLWRTFRSIALTFLVISGIGALIEDRGITKGLSF
jgi:ATP-dependent metalloprotease